MSNLGKLENGQTTHQEPQPEQALSVHEITSLDRLFELAKFNRTEPIPAAVDQALRLLFEQTEQSGAKLALVEAHQQRFILVFMNNEDIQRWQPDIDNFLAFQARVEPSSLWGTCIYIHMLAEELGLIDGHAGPISQQVDSKKAIYHISGFHDIGWKTAGDQTIFVDFTSQPYVFAGKKPVTPVFNGLVVIQSKVEVVPFDIYRLRDEVEASKSQPLATPIEHLYQCHWRLKPANLSAEEKTDIREQAKNFFFKRKKES